MLVNETLCQEAFASEMSFYEWESLFLGVHGSSRVIGSPVQLSFPFCAPATTRELREHMRNAAAPHPAAQGYCIRWLVLGVELTGEGVAQRAAGELGAAVTWEGED